jgi:hypothetical protein
MSKENTPSNCIAEPMTKLIAAGVLLIAKAELQVGRQTPHWGKQPTSEKGSVQVLALPPVYHCPGSPLCSQPLRAVLSVWAARVAQLAWEVEKFLLQP